MRKYHYKNWKIWKTVLKQWSTGWDSEESLRWWTFYSSNYVSAPEGHLSYVFVFVLHIFLLLHRCIYLHRITNTLSRKCQQWSDSCCTVEIRVKFIKWLADTHSFLHYAKCKARTLTTLAASCSLLQRDQPNLPLFSWPGPHASEVLLIQWDTTLQKPIKLHLCLNKWLIRSQEKYFC